MREELVRSEMMLGERALRCIAAKRVAVFGAGGVGGACCEVLARMGVGHITVVDNDTVSLSNINRQIIALHSTVGRYKADVMRERILDIAPETEVAAVKLFYLPENADTVDLSVFDYVVDAIDTVTAKLELITRCREGGVPVISSMGTGNKLDPMRFTVADISKTKVCPLAKVMRRELKKRGIESGVKVLYSEEPPVCSGTRLPASVPFVPPVAGMLIAREVILDLLENKNEA